MKIAKALLILVVLLLVFSSLVGCVASANPNQGQPSVKESKPAGFWTGVWQGMILPITFVLSLFFRNIGIYEVANNGGWYNFGFLIGVGIALGGSGSASRR